jgi:aryl-alcohol dehydrogenase-like predicted oxidoreductase
MIKNKKIELRSLGKTDILVSPIGLGVMEFAGAPGIFGHIFPIISQEEKNAIIKAALDGGINWFDTAEVYGFGISERSLVTALKANGIADNDVFIETKWQPMMRTARNISHNIDDRLRNLEGYSIANYMVHQPYGFSTPESEMNAMADLVEAGKIRSVGISNFSPDRMRKAHAALTKRGLPLAVNQVRYSLLSREIETNGILETARELGVTIVAYTPLARGVLSGKYHKNPELLSHMAGWRKASVQRDIKRSNRLINAMDEIANASGMTIAQVALNWLINIKGDIVVAIPAATKVQQAVENAETMKFHLSEDEMSHLDEISRQL